MRARTIIAIGGGEIKNKTTLKIDEYIASLAKERAGAKRANALFIGTASHDFMPYFNSFRKTYTSVFDIKAEVAMSVYLKTDRERLAEKFSAADMIYVGGGDTKFMIESWRESGIADLVLDAYRRGVIISGLSAGAICWFEEMYTDSEIVAGEGSDYKIMPALGVLKGLASPNYNERLEDFDAILLSENRSAIGIENDCAVVYENEVAVRAISSGGKAYRIACKDGKLIKTEIK
ncbi:MAG: Type 1 glutamine amidotransferase-like domain-containing protein [Clostridia bacterium]|nr:Type 1 glutamine amidotransferase-like domain-containing protein [Clostridia bacterium]